MSHRKTRREFNKSALALAGAPLLAIGSECAQGAAQQPAAVSPAQALADIVRARYGKFLDEDQLKRIRQEIAINIRIGELLHQSPTANADEPDFIFTADVL